MLTTIRPRSEGDFWLAQAGGISPAMLFSPTRVRETWRSLQAALPGVTCTTLLNLTLTLALLTTLVDEGACFDVASAPEIQALLPLGVPTQRMIHTHPIKTIVDLRPQSALA